MSDIKYPLPCGCAGPKRISMCAAHEEEASEDDGRRMGVADLTATVAELRDPAGVAMMKIQAWLERRQDKAMLVKVLK